MLHEGSIHYYRWLLQKKTQAREVSASKERCRKLFMKESRDLTRKIR